MIPDASGHEAAFRRRTRGRPPVISTEQLLKVAREVFLELGIRATTSEVASRAGIAEGTIFHRFKSKAELFRAAMNFDPDQALVLADGLLTPRSTAALRPTLVEFAERFLELGRIAFPVMMMSWSNPDSQLCADRTTERASRYQRVLAAVEGFLVANREVLPGADAEVMARMLVGSLQHYCMTELMMGTEQKRVSHREFAERVVDVLLAAGRAPGGSSQIGDAR